MYSCALSDFQRNRIQDKRMLCTSDIVEELTSGHSLKVPQVKSDSDRSQNSKFLFASLTKWLRKVRNRVFDLEHQEESAVSR